MGGLIAGQSVGCIVDTKFRNPLAQLGLNGGFDLLAGCWLLLDLPQCSLCGAQLRLLHTRPQSIQ